MPGVAAVFLDQVADEPADAGVLAVGPRGVRQPVESAAGQGRVESRSRSLDGTVPELVQPLGRVLAGGRELPVVAAVRAHVIPGRPERLAAQFHGGGVVLHRSQMLQQAADRERGRADPGLQSARVESVGLEPERGAQPVKGAEQLLGLRPGARRLPGTFVVSHGDHHNH